MQTAQNKLLEDIKHHLDNVSSEELYERLKASEVTGGILLKDYIKLNKDFDRFKFNEDFDEGGV